MYKLLTLIQDRRCEESRIMTLRNLFVRKLDFICNILYIRELVTQTLMNCFDKFVYFSKIYMHEWILVNETRYGDIEICDTRVLGCHSFNP